MYERNDKYVFKLALDKANAATKLNKHKEELRRDFQSAKNLKTLNAER